MLNNFRRPRSFGRNKGRFDRLRAANYVGAAISLGVGRPVFIQASLTIVADVGRIATLVIL
jgi:hypothetical protein